MARYTEAVCRICRREGEKLFLKGDRCYTDKCAMNRRAYAPGQHGQGRRKMSEYGTQLREKQKVRRAYGILEKQFAHYFEMANKKEGVTGENLLTLIERRLDNVVYRLGLAVSRPEARQLVSHAHITVNGKKVNIPSYLVKVGDVIALREKSRSSIKIESILGSTESKIVPKWLDMNRETLEGRVVAYADREDIDLNISEHLIVEYYSK
ncbi:MAG: 30S ribosomal protein S4 [Oscillospiraceae bacterium]